MQNHELLEALLKETPSGMGPHPCKIYLPISKENRETAVELGATRERDSVFVLRTQDLRPFQAMLPTYERTPNIEIAIDLIPASSWGASLAILLVHSCWDEVRTPFLANFGYRCEICGERSSYGKHGGLVDCHEVWSYHTTSSMHGVQKLERLMSICKDCHLMFHLGHANARGRGEFAIERLAEVNAWSDQRVEYEVEGIFRTWKARSGIEWLLDLSLVSDKVLRVKDTPAARDTTLLGVRYSYGRETEVRGPNSIGAQRPTRPG
jgi:hypothetical protein